MPCDYRQYPKNWKAIRQRILERAGHRCEGSPAYPECRAENYKTHPVTGSKVILTVAHLDHNPASDDETRLRAWCQRCHLTYDKDLHVRKARETKRKQEGELWSLPLNNMN